MPIYGYILVYPGVAPEASAMGKSRCGMDLKSAGRETVRVRPPLAPQIWLRRGETGIESYFLGQVIY
jgi:hypothetical protein